MAVFTKLNQADIFNVQNIFKFGKIQSFRGIKKGIENTNYTINTKKNKYVLTIFENRVNHKDLPYFMKLMDTLSKEGVNCPSPIKNKFGKYIFNLRRKKACLVSFLRGADKKKLLERDLFIIGKKVGLMHKKLKKINLKRKNSFSPLKIINLINKINVKNSRLPKNLKNEMKENFVDIKKNWPKNLPKSIIHGDLFIDNIFFNKKDFGGFIDFYFSAYDFQAYELAICINSLCFSKKKNGFKFDKKKARKLFSGYESIRKLRLDEKRSIKILSKGAALRYLATRAYDYINTPKNILIKKKDPSEYIQKLRFHNSIKKFEEYFND
tara:strand:+ start:13705 stop:14676 length:972 start_codon:yes stop_codon:yes gene_type:complete